MISNCLFFICNNYDLIFIVFVRSWVRERVWHPNFNTHLIAFVWAMSAILGLLLEYSSLFFLLSFFFYFFFIIFIPFFFFILHFVCYFLNVRLLTSLLSFSFFLLDCIISGGMHHSCGDCHLIISGLFGVQEKE